MTSKKNTTYLLLGVILIYGAIVVRFFMLRSDNTESILTTNTVANFNPKNYEVQQEFIIENNHRDPFLGTLPTTRTTRKTNSAPVKFQKSSEYYPTVQYRGIVSDTDSNRKVISLVVNGQEYIIREGKTVDSVKILSGNSKELKVVYKGTTRKFKITN